MRRGTRKNQCFDLFMKRLKTLLLNLKVYVLNKLSTDHDVRNRAEINFDSLIFEHWTTKPKRKRFVYMVLGIMIFLFVGRFLWNVNFENLTIHDLEKNTIMNAFGANSNDYLSKSDLTLSTLVQENQPLTRLSKDTELFKKGYVPVFILENGEKNITFDKMFDDIFASDYYGRGEEGCLCAGEFGLTLDAIFLWQKTEEKEKSYTQLYSPKVTFASSTFYQAQYELGSYVCTDTIDVEFLVKNGDVEKERFHNFLAVCICSCNDFISKFSTIKYV